MEDLIKEMLIRIGEDPSREGLVRTPRRVSEAMKMLMSGYGQDPDALLASAVFTEEYDEMVVVRDIEIYSMCEHHMLPFFGKCHIAYIPQGRIAGLSKLARVADIYARRLQLQERLTYQIARTIERQLQPEGVGVIIEAQHLCMMMRGVQKQNSVAVTSAMLGSFRDEEETRMEFMNLVRNG